MFNLVDRSGYRKCTDNKKDIIEVIGDDCYIPTTSYCFIKSINCLTGQDYKQEALEITWNQQWQSHVMTQARIQPFCKANNITTGLYSGKELFPETL